jgi:vacuolar-type H+-ATPase subunit B/Vma2
VVSATDPHGRLTNMLYHNYFKGLFVSSLCHIIDDLVKILRRFLQFLDEFLNNALPSDES